MKDHRLKCVGCSADFIYTAGERRFFSAWGFKRDPIRCKPCKARLQSSVGGFVRTIASVLTPDLRRWIDEIFVPDLVQAYCREN